MKDATVNLKTSYHDGAALVNFATYETGEVVIVVVDTDNTEVITVPTVNLADYGHKALNNEVTLRATGEDSLKVIEALREADIIGDLKYTVNYGHNGRMVANVHELKGNRVIDNVVRSITDAVGGVFNKVTK